ncbi:hypothetical protein EG359_06225 [Chryseobacterium joostei]|uniref:Methyltransferase domain-containing protein n=1 Tax=Chryseobacterium joostei TaxID=112234 RepID=A0A1N7HT18_9FLAO|nr:hypothetical protein [Chryseobacterium joostei]AZA99226.1 hypothetical protein EG359_06225 [Chryseobacterium joostei]SIS27898.1 hypothetical protein SAMN05421768_101112 [Chryseobacterium joostei]
MMELSDFSARIIQLIPEEIINYVAENQSQLKLMFINLEVDALSIEQCSTVLLRLSSLDLVKDQRETGEMQFLYKELGLFFKKANKQGHVENCAGELSTNIFKNRLIAWLHHKHYTNARSHIGLFENYLEKLSLAITDGEEDYENDVLRDLHTYYEETSELLEEHGQQDFLQQFQELFDNNDLIERHKVLDCYQINKHQFTTEVVIIEEREKIYEPSVFTAALFEAKFLNYVKDHHRTIWYEILLGYDAQTIRKKIINFGQAHFDKTYEHLSANDIVKLYSYFNMRKHYFSTLYLLERFDLIHRYHNVNGRIKFIDIGCGPATSGIALVDHLNTKHAGVVSFDYFGVDFYNSMREEAEYMMNNDVYVNENSTFYMERLGHLNYDDLDDANSIFVNTCYLFASDSLDEEELARDVMNVRKAKEETPLYILYQNTTEVVKNEKYNSFKTYLGEFNVVFSAKCRIFYNTKRNSYNSPTLENVNFEILEIV